MPVRTLAQALSALALAIDPELVRALAAAGEDPQWHIASSRSMLDWLPWWRLVERRQRLLAELLSRVQSGTWQLIWFADDPIKEAPFPEGQVAKLTIDSFDAENSVVILGERRHRVGVEEISASNAAVAAPPKKPGRPPLWPAVMEWMRADLKQQPNGEWKLIDENGNHIEQKNWDKRYHASRNTCLKAFEQLTS